MSSFFWDLKCVQNHKESVKSLLAYEKCCGLFSVRVGTLLLTLMSFLFSFSIIGFDWLVIQIRMKSLSHANISSATSPHAIDYNTTYSICDWLFPWSDEQHLSLWILIPVAFVAVTSILGFIGALFKWSVLLIPYCVYRFFWFLFVLIFFIPFLFVELLVLVALSLFPVCPYFLVVLTWIVNFFENILVAILASEIIVIEFHMMSVVFGCYLECKNSNVSVGEEPPDVFDPSMHVAIEVEKQKSYRTIE